MEKLTGCYRSVVNIGCVWVHFIDMYLCDILTNNKSLNLSLSFPLPVYLHFIALSLSLIPFTLGFKKLFGRSDQKGTVLNTSVNNHQETDCNPIMQIQVIQSQSTLVV